MAVSVAMTVITVILFVIQVIVALVNIEYCIKLPVVYFILTLIGLCNIISYCFGVGSLLGLIIGLIVVLESAILSCVTLYNSL